MPVKMCNISGNRYGKLVVISYDKKAESGRHFWNCICDCGKHTSVASDSLKSGNTKSCGCINVERFRRIGIKNRKYYTPVDMSSPEYVAYCSMKNRCSKNAKPEYFKNYYARGIAVCSEWNKRGGFIEFLKHVGRRPGVGFSLDRINNDKGYEPGNVRWADWKTQARNRRKNLRSKRKSWIEVLQYFTVEELVSELNSRGVKYHAE